MKASLGARDKEAALPSLPASGQTWPAFFAPYPSLGYNVARRPQGRLVRLTATPFCALETWLAARSGGVILL